MKLKFRARYFKENWGAPFIIAFQILLILAAVQLANGLQDAANETAVYAYYALVAGVLLQITSYIRYERKKEPQKVP
jgi:hypothetical protein